jgi:DNA replication protein DnaC
MPPFLEIIMADEVTRRDNRNVYIHLQQSGFEEVCRLEDFDWTASITEDRKLLDAVFSLEFLNHHVHVLFIGPVGLDKSFLSQSLGYATVSTGHSVHFIRVDGFFRTLAQPRIDHTLENTFSSFISPDLLIQDDFGL